MYRHILSHLNIGKEEGGEGYWYMQIQLLELLE